MLCLANQNGSRVECELGNPLRRGAEVGAAPPRPCSCPPAPAPPLLPLSLFLCPQVRFFLILSTSGITLQTTDLAVELALST